MSSHSSLDCLMNKYSAPWEFFCEKSICPVPFVRINVNSKGDVHCCCDIERLNPPSPEAAALQCFGSVLTERYDQLWNNSKIQSWRKIVLAGGYEKICSDSCSKKFRVINKDRFLFPHKELITWQHVSMIMEKGENFSVLPGFMQVKGSTACNLECRMCRNSFITKASDIEERTNDIVFNKILPEYISSLKVLEASPAGEIFLSSSSNSFLQKIKMYETTELSLRIVSNGVLLTSDRFSWLENANVKQIRLNISIDASTKETYDKIRLRGDWNKLLENLQHIKSKKLSSDIGKRLHITLSFVVQLPNVHEISSFARFAREYGADAVNFQRLGGGHVPEWDFIKNNNLEAIKILNDQLAAPIMSEPFVICDQFKGLQETTSIKVSVITPSYNQAQFLPINLESIKKQKKIDVEHIIVDPGSTDGSTEIARLATGVTLISEPDRGQSDGICKGFTRSNGDILVWLNSDDYYPDENILSLVVQCFKDNPDVDIVYGDVNFVDEKGEFLRKGFVNKNADQLLATFEYQVGIVQPGVFWRRRVFNELGGPSEEFEYCMDYELWVRMATKRYKWKYIPKVLAHHRWWGGMKTSSRRDLSLREHFKVCDRYFGYVHWKWLDRYADFLCSNQDGVVNHAEAIDAGEKAIAIRKAIDEVVTQEMMCKLWMSSDPELCATRQYIQAHHPDKKRIFFKQCELNILTEDSDDPNAHQRVAWNIFDVSTSDGKSFAAYHVPDNFDRYFEQEWYEEQLSRSKLALTRLQKERRGDTCVIIGNGPSLRESDLSLLSGVDTIMSNYAVLSPDLTRFAKILTVVNDLVARQGAIDFNASNFIKVVPFWLANYFNNDDNTFFVNATVRPEFSTDFVKTASWRSTVSFFNMQLAYAIGYRKVILIGFDHSYVQPKGVVEGVVITQVEDDDNHFDPRYFKGKDWQAADTTNMEKMYLVAKSAYEKDGREIVNCTVGGKLDLFRRSDLALEIEEGYKGQTETINRDKLFPKLLMIDSTPVGHISATGQLKQTFLGDWPKAAFLQIWESGGEHSNLHVMQLEQSIENSCTTALSLDSLIEWCRNFDPDVIYFRPVDSELLFEVAEQVVQSTGKPLIVHMMDDWPERLRLSAIEKYLKLNVKLHNLIQRADKCLSICQTMSDAYHARYGGEWLPLSNGVDISEFPFKDWSKRPPISPVHPFVIRYMGALADDMTYTSVRDIADTVATMQIEYPLRFEIYTMEWCIAKAEQYLGTLPGVFINPLVDEQYYRRKLCEADALVIAYNFDPKSIGYIGLSLANKLPECLASGVPLLAYGPPEVATITYLKGINCATVVDRRDRAALRHAIQNMTTLPGSSRSLGKKGRAFAAEHLSKNMVKNKFREYITESNKKVIPIMKPVIGPFERQQSAHYDETECIAELYSRCLIGQTMIDVGAHHGWALTPFLNKGWQIFAFEPDNENRAKLIERIFNHTNKSLINIDTHAVSNKSQTGLTYYRSDVSTGISGLSAFHKSHEEAHMVDSITLTDFFANMKLPDIDFLKIDTEGHDLFVLQGFPWERCKPAVIECEFEDLKTVPLGYTFHDLADYLVEKGYIVYVSEWHPIIQYGISHDWNRLMRYPCTLANEQGWGNLLAFRNPINEEVLIEAVHSVLKVGSSDPVKPTVANANRSIAFSIQFSGILPSRYFKPASENVWRYVHSNESDQKLLVAVYDINCTTVERSFVAGIRLVSNKQINVQVCLGRHGKTDFEGSSKRITLQPNIEQKITLTKLFSMQHSALKVQVEVLELYDGTTADLTIDTIYVTESLSVTRQRTTENEMKLPVANRLYREKDFSKAMGIYLHLHGLRPLKMYSENAFMCARKLGMGEVSSVNELLKHIDV